MSLAIRGISGHLNSEVLLSTKNLLQEIPVTAPPEESVILLPTNPIFQPKANTSMDIACCVPTAAENSVSITTLCEPTKRKILKSIIKALKNDKAKKFVNYTINGSAVMLGLITFANGNLHIYDPIQGNLEVTSEMLSKIAIGTIHALGTIDLYQKKNFFPCIGYAMVVPITALVSGYNLILSTGIGGALINMIVVIDQREVVDEKGEPILDKDGNIQVINGDFRDRGWLASIKTTVKESKKMLRELVHKPSRLKKVSHAAFVSGLGTIIGSAIGLCGLTTLGAWIKTPFSIVGETALLLHKNIKNKTKTESKRINLKSPIAQAGLLWNGSYIVDLLKRIPFVSETFNSLTHLSLLFDRLASMRFTQGVLNIKKEEGKNEEKTT